MDIAVIGYAGRFPGARNVDEFWRNLCAGTESIAVRDDRELQDSGVADEYRSNPAYVKVEAMMPDYSMFDASFFGYTDREAMVMDPQQRVFLEVCWEAVEDAGYFPRRLTPSTGVFAAAGANSYLFHYLYPAREQLQLRDPFEVEVGNNLSALANRVSYKLNLKGPSIAVQTACSSSLVAVHLAAQSLLSLECDMALAGGCYLKLPAGHGYLCGADGLLSPDGHCRAFDRDARGTVFGSGAGVVVLKRLADAQTDGDHIRAVIKGSAVNNDGAERAGFTAPSENSQAELISEALSVAGIDSQRVHYVETHGTGTTLGDPVEIGALTKAFSGTDIRKDQCAIGSTKPNIGHLDVASGIASLIKTVMALEHRLIPPSINYRTPHPQIPFDRGPFFVNTSLRSWAASGTPRCAGVSSFGLGGTNCHLVLEEAPAFEPDSNPPGWQVIPLSGKSAQALTDAAERLAQYLTENPAAYSSDLAYTYQISRSHFPHRRAIVSQNRKDAIAQLRGAASKGSGASSERIGFLFTGAAWTQETFQSLYESEHLFRKHVDDCFLALKTNCGVEIDSDIPVIPGKYHDLHTFIADYSFARAVIDAGVSPSCVAGVGCGLLAAACVAGAIGCEDALQTAVEVSAQSESEPERGGRPVVNEKEWRTIEIRGGAQREQPADLSENADGWLVVGSGIERTHEAERLSAIATCDTNAGDGAIACVLARLWERGCPIRWEEYSGKGRRRGGAPTYPFERKQFWPDLKKFAVPGIAASAPSHGETEEELVTAAVSALLLRDGITAEVSFTEAGGDSLLAGQLASIIREKLGVAVSLREILESRSLGDICDSIRSARLEAAGMLRPIPIADRSRPLPLSFAQRRLWFLASLDADNPLYNISVGVRIQGMPDVRGLELAIRDVIERHESLRTSFRVDDSGEPFQFIEPLPDVPLPITDLRHIAEAEREAALQMHARTEAQKPFHLDAAPLFRPSLFRTGEQNYSLVFTIHHTIADWWSLGVLIRDAMNSLHRHSVPGVPAVPALTVQYADFAVWQRNDADSPESARQITYWKQRLAGPLPLLNLMTDHPRPPVRTNRGSRQSLRISRELHIALRNLSSARNATLYMTLLSAFATLLTRHTGQTDILIGSPVAHRQTPGLENLVGCFVNILAMRIDTCGNPPFIDLLDRVKAVALEAYVNQDVPFERIVEEQAIERDLSVTPIFQSLFVLNNTPSPRLDGGGLKITGFDIDPGTCAYDLTLSLAETDDGLLGCVEYNADLFESQTISRLAGEFRLLLEGIVQRPAGRLWFFDLLPEEDQKTLIASSSGITAADEFIAFPEMVARWAECRSDAVAVAHDDCAITYGELHRRANQLARYLRHLGAGNEIIVGLYTPRSPATIIGLLGILQSGAASVPIDDVAPGEHVRACLRGARASVVVTTQALAANVGDASENVVCVDSDWGLIERESAAAVPNRFTAASLAYVIFTSGSTGLAKGVMVTHGGLSNLVRAQQQAYGVTPADRILLYFSMAFDASIFQIAMALGTGAQLFLATRAALLPTQGFVRLLRTLAITNLAIFPSALSLLDREDLPALGTLIVGGEPCPPGVLNAWRGGRRIFNSYGACETTVWITHCDLSTLGEMSGVTLGGAIRNSQAYVLDEYLNPAPPGIPGQLYVAGLPLARGYLGRPDLTAERFLPNPFSDRPAERMYATGDRAVLTPEHEIRILGRADEQMKVQGVRIEPGEIESVLTLHPAIKQAAVVSAGEGAGKVLVAYLISEGGQQLPEAGIRAFLAQRLPPYMLPSAYILTQKFPVLPGGKTDRLTLSRAPLPRQQRRPGNSPRTDIQTQVVTIVEKQLNIEGLGIDDNLFEAGAHSLALAHLKGKLDREFQREIPLLEMFRNPTVRGIAKAMEAEPQTDQMADTAVARAGLRQELRHRRSHSAELTAVAE